MCRCSSFQIALFFGWLNLGCGTCGFWRDTVLILHGIFLKKPHTLCWTSRIKKMLWRQKLVDINIILACPIKLLWIHLHIIEMITRLWKRIGCYAVSLLVFFFFSLFNLWCLDWLSFSFFAFLLVKDCLIGWVMSTSLFSSVTSRDLTDEQVGS